MSGFFNYASDELKELARHFAWILVACALIYIIISIIGGYDRFWWGLWNVVVTWFAVFLLLFVIWTIGLLIIYMKIK